MSLFGDSSPNNRSLFASPSFSGSPSLFDDEHNSNGSGLDSGGTPWDNDVAIASHSSSRISSTRLANPNDVAAILLTAENAVIPSAYYDIYEKLVNEFGGSDGAVQAHGVERVFDEAAVYGEERRRIWDVVVGMKESVGRGEVWCLLAMVGLVREGEDEVNVDSVDDRRMNLPVPVLKDLMPEPKKQEPLQTPPPESYGNNVVLNQNRNIHTQSAQELPTADKPTFVARQQSTPISTTPVRARNTGTLLSSSVDDPWGSVTTPTAAPHRPPSQQVLQQPPPQPHHFPAQADGVASAGDEEADNEPDDIHAALRNTGPSRATTSSTWGGDNFGSGENYSQGTMGFGDHPGLGARHGSFGGLGGNRLNGNLQGPMDSNRLNAGLERIKEAMKAPEEHVVVNMLPEKEGLFMFQHRNYQVASSRRGSRVVRRYSDFVWLLDCLHKRYLFRQLPLLPPKRLAVNGHYLSADAAFLERRRRGLARFVNALVRHPILAHEQLVIMFLTVPTELAVWRKQATFSVVEEFTNKPLPPDLEASLPPDLNETFETVRSGLRRSSEIYIQLCNLLERLEKRHQGIASDYGRFAACLSSLTDASEATYAVDTNDIPLLNDGLAAVGKGLNQSRALLEDEAKAWDAGVLEDLKRQRDTLVSMRELFERMDRYAGNNIPQLQKRIKTNEGRLSALRTKPAEQVKPGEMERVIEAIEKDTVSIETQRRRGILIKECVRDELVFFQASQYHVSRLHQEWSLERVKYAELQAECWRNLSVEVEGMPTGE